MKLLGLVTNDSWNWMMVSGWNYVVIGRIGIEPCVNQTFYYYYYYYYRLHTPMYFSSNILYVIFIDFKASDDRFFFETIILIL